METKANYVLVGVFTMVALAAAFAFVYWTAAIGDRGELATLRIRITGSASGLGRGSAVLFNGVKVGDIRRVYLDVNNPNAAVADAEIDRHTPITRSTQANIGLAGLTGQANVNLEGANPAEPNLLDDAEAKGEVAEITANPSAVTNLLQTAQDIFKRADNVLGQVEGFVADARTPLTASLNNVQTFTDALAKNSDGIDKFLASVAKLSDEIGGVSARLDSTLTAAENLLSAVDRDRISTIVANVETFTSDLRETGSQFDAIVARVETALGSINEFASNTNATLEKVDRVVDAVDPAKVRVAMENVERATETASKAASDVAAFTDRIGKRTDDIDQIITDARGLADRLNQASTRIDGVLARADEALKGAGDLVGAVDKDKIAAVVANVEAFTSDLRETGRQFDALLGRVDGAISSVDQIIASVDPAKVRATVDNIEKAGETANKAAADVAIVTDRIGKRADDVDQIITDARELAGRLNQASVRIDGVLAKVDGLLGSGDAQGLVASASETLLAYRKVADTLNARLGVITDGLARFSGPGLQDVEALVRDSRRSITRIEQAISDFERNPQRILSGGDGAVRQFDGRARR